MQSSRMSFKNMMVAPHHLAAKTGSNILKEGGNAVEAMIASAAMISVVYPHMNSMGGDNFWLISDKNKNVKSIDACGGAANSVSIDFYKKQGYNSIPPRGPLAALTVPGAVSGWKMAYDYSVNKLGGKLSLERLLQDAQMASEEGISVTHTLRNNLEAKAHQLVDIPGFKDVYYKNGKIPEVGDKLQFTSMSKTFSSLITHGLDDFYRGQVAQDILSDLETLGSPLKKVDFDNYNASFVNPLQLDVMNAKLFNLPPPTQGLASILILGVLGELSKDYKKDTDLIHKVVEATKVVFKVRDKYICDPEYMTKKTSEFLNKDFIKHLAKKIDLNKALPWPDANIGGDTVWLGASDSFGNTVSFIQSIYWEFGSGLILPKTGITMQNRGISFSLEECHFNKLLPSRKPFHTIQPALAHFNDGRVMAYGTMGGEGQPQTQATIFLRYALQNLDLQKAINEPRWLLGRTWGDETTSLKIEGRFDNITFNDLTKLGHNIEKVGDFEEIMGHAGAIVDHPSGLKEGAYDLRSDGDAVGG